MHKIILSDGRGYRGNRGPTHFVKTRMISLCGTASSGLQDRTRF